MVGPLTYLRTSEWTTHVAGTNRSLHASTAAEMIPTEPDGVKEVAERRLVPTARVASMSNGAGDVRSTPSRLIWLAQFGNSGVIVNRIPHSGPPGGAST